MVSTNIYTPTDKPRAIVTLISPELSPILALLLVHDFLLAKSGIALPASHGLRAAVERHKSRLTSEFTRARIRRRASSIDALRLQIEEAAGHGAAHPRWVRINTIRTTLDRQLGSTLSGFGKADSIAQVLVPGAKLFHIDEHVPHLIALPPGTDLTKTDAYRSGSIILQDKASCFPAYLLNPCPEDGDFIDSCAAPGNKTTHIAALLSSSPSGTRSIFAFEKNPERAKTLRKMVQAAGSQGCTKISSGQDFLKVDPKDGLYQNVGALLLDPSCSGSGIVGRDAMPELHLPRLAGAKDTLTQPAKKNSRKRKHAEAVEDEKRTIVDDDGNTTILASEGDLAKRLEALSSFQLSLVLHALQFPAARKVTYSTCSVHAEENEHVVLKVLGSDIAKQRGWRILERKHQVDGLRRWPVRGDVAAARGDEALADACIRAYKDDGRGVMGFFVAGFVRDEDADETDRPGDDEKRRADTGETAVLGSTGGTSDDDDESEWEGFED